MGEGAGRGLIHTNTTGSHVGGHHDGALSSLELVQDPVTLVLLFVTVNGERGPAVLAEEASNLVSNPLCAGEDKNLVLLVVHNLLHVTNHLVALLGFVADLNDLCNAMVGREIQGTDVDLDEVVEEVLGKVTDLLGPGGGPHESLTVRSDLADNLANLGLETHVQHAIGLVEHQVCDTAQVGLASLQHIDETARSGNADLDTTGKVADLGSLGNTTIDTGVPNARRLAELAHLLLNLYSKFTGRGKDKDDGTITLGQERLGVDVDNGRKTVGKCLAGTCLGNTDHITTRQCHGPALRLNGGRGREALGLHFVDDITGKASLVEGLDGLGNVVAVDSHGVVLSELVNLCCRASRNLGVLLVEGLLETGHGVKIW